MRGNRKASFIYQKENLAFVHPTESRKLNKEDTRFSVEYRNCCFVGKVLVISKYPPARLEVHRTLPWTGLQQGLSKLSRKMIAFLQRHVPTIDTSKGISSS